MPLPSVEGSATSIAAADRALPRAGTNRRLVHDTIDLTGTRGMTDEELIARLRGRIPENGIRARRVDLSKAGLLVKAGTRKTKYDCDAVVWVTKRHARKQLDLSVMMVRR